jgi:hypothetical protein
MLVNTAFTPILNHVLMTLPASDELLEELNKEVTDFMWTRQRDGEIRQKRRRVAKTRLPADFHLGGLRIPTFQTIAKGLRLNLLQKIHKREKFPNKYPASYLPRLMQITLTQTGRPSLQQHVDSLGTNEWHKTAQTIKPINQMLSMAFTAGAQLLALYEKRPDFWHLTPIIGHLNEGPFKIQFEEKQYLQDNNIIVIGQLYQENDNGTLTATFNNDVNNQLQDNGNLLIKLQHLHNNMKKDKLNIQDKRTFPVSILSLLLQKDSNISMINKKAEQELLETVLQTAPAYRTRERDGVYVPDKSTFKAGYQALKIRSLPSKTKEVMFETLNRTIWTNNKSFKSGLSPDPNCRLCGEIETMEHLLHSCPHYSEPLWAENSTIITELAAQISGNPVARINLTPREIIFNAAPPGLLLHIKDDTSRTIILQHIQETKRDIIYRRMNIRENQEGQLTPLIRIQAHIISTINKLISLMEYQGLLSNKKTLFLLRAMRTIAENRVV